MLYFSLLEAHCVRRDLPFLSQSERFNNRKEKSKGKESYNCWNKKKISLDKGEEIF